MLDVTDLSKHYGDVRAVDDVSLSVEDGEFFSIVGPSGSGKSTLLRCIAGLEAPQDGRILLDDRDVTAQKAYERDSTMVFQNLALFPHMTVRENIAYGMKRQGIEKDKREKRIKEYLELVDLEGYIDRNTNQLSGGEQQRVALARSLAVRPKLLLLDEPLASLDQQLRVQLQNELYDLQRQLDQTAIYVTHDQNVALSISDRVAVMKDGEVEQVGTPHDLYENPQTEFVASFIGDSNSFTGTAEAVTNGTVDIALNGSDELIRGKAIGDISTGDRVRGVVKLEDFDVDSSDAYPNQLQGTVKRISYRGLNSKILLDITEDLDVEVFTPDVDTFEVGERVTFGWSDESCPTYRSRV